MIPNMQRFWAFLATIVACAAVAGYGIGKGYAGLAIVVTAVSTPFLWYCGRSVGDMFARALDKSTMADQVSAEADAVQATKTPPVQP